MLMTTTRGCMFFLFLSEITTEQHKRELKRQWKDRNNVIAVVLVIVLHNAHDLKCNLQRSASTRGSERLHVEFPPPKLQQIIKTNNSHVDVLFGKSRSEIEPTNQITLSLAVTWTNNCCK